MHVYLLAAMTVDGFIGRHGTERSFNWTSAEDKQFYIEKIKSADAIIMGMRTFQTFERYPKNSRWILYTNSPEEFANPKPDLIQAEATQEDPAVLLARLAVDGVEEVAICGGASIYGLFMKAGLVDTLYLTVEPVIFGDGVRLLTDPMETNLTLTEVKKLSEQTIVLEYQVKRS